MTILVIACAFTVSGCANLHSPKDSTYHLAKGMWTVQFHAGPRVDAYPTQSFSSYVVLFNAPSDHCIPSLHIGSAQSWDYTLHSPKERPTDWIKLFVSDSGRSLLIQEAIPNDCNACSNYIFATYDGHALNSHYLSFPVRGAGTGDTANVSHISDTEVTITYPDGFTKTLKIASAKKREQRPDFPG